MFIFVVAGVLLMILIVFALPIEYSVSHDCPASCIVCMENATICQGLTYILALRSLEHLDLSRNRISVMPDSFSHLSKLSVLNLDLNHWNCTCELKELSLFLRNFIKSPDRTLINAKDLVCEATESSAIQTLFQLTDANCVPSSENITIILKNEFYRQYVRDIALAAVFCFAGMIFNKFLCSEGLDIF
uniref:LRRCT domain-containing protein n=1 Tax=Callorhinchus milii TaxID=7868 RepID=A0A4W3HYP3_CALMI